MDRGLDQDTVNALWETWLDFAARYGYSSEITRDAYQRYQHAKNREETARWRKRIQRVKRERDTMTPVYEDAWREVAAIIRLGHAKDLSADEVLALIADECNWKIRRYGG